MESPSIPSWAGQGTMEPPKTVERRRKGRNVDVILPTPPRPNDSYLPTPETLRRSAKPQTRKTQHINPAPTMIIGLPTPQTLPRPSRAATQSNSDPASPPSPSGHTTFYLSGAQHAPAGEKIVRRRPGLTFAQQMGLLSSSTSSAVSFGGRLGAGVGMGGARTGGHKVDQVVWTRVDDEATKEEDNPFLVADLVPPGLAAPGRNTMHVPGDALDDDTPMASPLTSARPPKLDSSAFKTPTRTKPSRDLDLSADEARRQARSRMMDEDSNPFLSQPGETRHPGPKVDESRPTVTYVFRGAKKEFVNPFISPDASYPSSTLDPTHEDYEPHPTPKPRLLWPIGPAESANLPQASTSSSKISDSPPSTHLVTPARRLRRYDDMEVDEMNIPARVFSDPDIQVEEDEDEADLEPTVRRGMLFAPGSGMKRGSSDETTGTHAKKVKGIRM